MWWSIAGLVKYAHNGTASQSQDSHSYLCLPLERHGLEYPLMSLSEEGYKYDLTIIDCATHYPEAIPLKGVDSETTCRALLDIFHHFGVPHELLSDNGANFTSAVTEELLRHLDCFHIKSSPYRPQTNGMIEWCSEENQKTS